MDRALGDGRRGGDRGRRGRGRFYEGRGFRGEYRGGRGDGRGGRGFGGRKRPREDPDPDGSKALLNRIFHLNDHNKGSDRPAVSEIEDMVTALMRDPPMLKKAMEMIIDCAVEISVKTPCYAALCGLINSEDSSFGKELVERLHSDFEGSMQKGERHRPRMLLRFFAALVLTNVVLPSSLIESLQEVVGAALGAARRADGDEDGRLWQPWADHLVYSALVCLPWAGAELAEGATEDLDALLDTVSEYMELRPRRHSTALVPFLGGGPDHEDRSFRSDSGGATFLPRLWEAVQELKANGWTVEAVPQLHIEFESRLAQGQPHAIPKPELPSSPPCVTEGMDDITAASAVFSQYRPRGAICLLPEGVDGSAAGKPAMERIVVEEYILDILHWFDGDRRETVVRLSALPVPFKYEAILIETLFGQLLCLPMPPRKPVGYLTIMVDCMKTIEKFSKPLSGCVRELFARMESLDPELQTRLAEWLAYHLSCFEFQWPWPRWEHVLERPPTDAQRRFCVAVLSRMLRLSYYDRVAKSVPESFVPLLPPKPEPQPLEQPMAEAPGEPPGGEPGAEERRCGELIGMVRAKDAPESILEWMEEQRLSEELGGPSALLSMALRTLLVAGAKSFTHTLIALERYLEVLKKLATDAGDEAEAVMVSTAAKVWMNSPQRAAIAIDRLMGMRLVQAPAVVRWVFASRGMTSLADELAKGLAWEVLVNCTNKMVARASDEEDDLKAIEPAYEKAKDDAERAAKAVEEATMMEGTMEGRLSMLQERESMANIKFQEIKEDYDAKLASFRTAEELRDEHLTDVFRSYVDLLSPQLSEDDAGGEGAHPAWVEGALGSLRAFTRSYHIHVARIAAEILDSVLPEGSVHPLLRSTVEEKLYV